jgi:hypothetical protein
VASQKIPVYKVVQHAHEIIITFPGAYHQGYNTGFNLAESVNFATESWLEFAKRAGFCECVEYSVQMDVEKLFGIEKEVKIDEDDTHGIKKRTKKRSNSSSTSSTNGNPKKSKLMECPTLPNPRVGFIYVVLFMSFGPF